MKKPFTFYIGGNDEVHYTDCTGKELSVARVVTILNSSVPPDQATYFLWVCLELKEFKEVKSDKVAYKEWDAVRSFNSAFAAHDWVNDDPNNRFVMPVEIPNPKEFGK